MKLSKLQEILKEYQDKYGDIEIVLDNFSNGKICTISKQDFKVLPNDNPNSNETKFIKVWVI